MFVLIMEILKKTIRNLLILVIAVHVHVQCENIHLNKLSTLHVPSSYTANGEPVFALRSRSAEQLAYDPQDKVVYIVGASKLSVVNISDLVNPKLVFHEFVGDFDPTDVEVCGDYVFVALDNNQNREDGRVVVFKRYDLNANTIEAVLNISDNHVWRLA